MPEENNANLTIEITGEMGETFSPPAVAILAALETVKEFKPSERGDVARAYAVTITMLEQAYAYFLTWAMDDLGEQITGENGGLPPVA